MHRMVEPLGIVRGNPLRGFTIGLLVLMVSGAIATPALLAARLEPIFPIVSAVFAAAALFVLPVVAFVSRPIVLDIRRIRRQHLIHWQYAEDEWRRFEAAEWRRAKREARVYLLFGFALALAMGSFALLFARTAVALGLLFGVFLVVGVVVSAQTLIGGWLRVRSSAGVNGDVYIGSEGVLQPRGYRPTRGINLRLKELRVEEGDPFALCFVTESWSESATKLLQEFRIPIPRGKEHEARMLALQLVDASVLAAPR